jgi:hypothetical protein
MKRVRREMEWILIFKGIALVLFGLFFCLPIILKILPPQSRSSIQVFSTSFGASIGFLTLWMAYLAFFYKPLFNIYGIVIPISVFFVILSILLLRNWTSLTLSKDDPSSSLERLSKGLILFSCLTIFWESIYYPFVTQDAITHYAIPAKDIFLTGGMDKFHVPHLSGQVDAYPLLVPLSYVYTYFAFGEVSEHAAKVIPAIFSLGLIGSTYLLGRCLFNRRIGLFSALILSFSPFFLRWANSGYTDIPCAFFYTYSILYYWLTYRYRSMPYAILTGLMVGFSIWVRNGALLIFISILLFFFIQRIFSKKWGEEDIPFRHLAVILSISLVLGGPWYLRTYLLYQYLVPSFIQVPEEGFWIDYGVSILKYFGNIGYHFSAIYVFGLLYGFTRLIRTDRRTLFLFCFIFPYLMVWLLKYSYETRFLLMILPLFVVLGVGSMAEFFRKVFDALARKKIAVWLICISLVLPHVGYVIHRNKDLFSHPFAGDDEKRLKKMKRFYPVVLYFKDIQSKGHESFRIITGERRFIYFFDRDKVSHQIPTKMEELKNFDYFVYTHYTLEHYQKLGKGEVNEVWANLTNEKYFIKVFESGGNIVYKIIH